MVLTSTIGLELIVFICGGVIVTGFIKAVYEPLSEYYFRKRVLPVLRPFYQQIDQYLPQWLQDFTAEKLEEILLTELESANNKVDSKTALSEDELERLLRYVLDEDLDIRKVAAHAKPKQRDSVERIEKLPRISELPIEVTSEQPEQVDPNFE